MPTADATLLPPPFAGSVEERGSARRLDEIGVETILGAMIEQKRRASQPSFSSISSISDLADRSPESRSEDDEDDTSSERAPSSAGASAVFLKAR